MILKEYLQKQGGKIITTITDLKSNFCQYNRLHASVFSALVIVRHNKINIVKFIMSERNRNKFEEDIEKASAESYLLTCC